MCIASIHQCSLNNRRNICNTGSKMKSALLFLKWLHSWQSSTKLLTPDQHNYYLTHKFPYSPSNVHITCVFIIMHITCVNLLFLLLLCVNNCFKYCYATPKSNTPANSIIISFWHESLREELKLPPQFKNNFTIFLHKKHRIYQLTDFVPKEPWERRSTGRMSRETVYMYLNF